MTTRTARRAANAVVATAGLLVAASIVLVYGRDLRGQDSADWIYITGTALGAAIYLWIGRAIVTRQPANTIGWLLLAIPTLALLAGTNGGYASRTLVFDPGSLPFGTASAWVDRWILIPTLAAFIPLFLLYPDGRLPSRGWRPVAFVAFVAPVLTAVAFAITPGRLTGALSDLTPARVTNPFGIEAAAGLIDALTVIGGSLIFLSAIASVVAIAVRYRREDREVRQQIRWLALVGIAFFVLVGMGVLGSALFGENDAVGNWLFMLMFLTLVVGIPVACGVAILKYRLYDLDVVIRKAVVFGGLAAFITLVYVGVVVGIGTALGRGGEPNVGLSIAATAIVAVAFQPVRERTQRFANRLVYGKRATPYDVLTRFSERVAGAYATEDVVARTARVIAEGTGATRVDVWLHVGDELRAAASWPEGAESRDPVALVADELPALGAGRTTAVRLGEELLGAITVDKPASEPFRPAEEELLDDLAGQAGLVLSNVRMTAELEANLERIGSQSAELRTSRQRIVVAQDGERRRLERNIHDGAQQHLVALAVKLRLAKQMLGRDPEKARSMLLELQGAVGDALDTLTSLALGIYPPLLEEQGIAPALAAQYTRSGLPVHLSTPGARRYPIEVEAAVYFCVLEALQNAAKHAHASRIDVVLAERGNELAFEVSDDGVGFEAAANGNGTGLEGMRDRLAVFGGEAEVESARGRGTTVRGRVPIEAGVTR